MALGNVFMTDTDGNIGTRHDIQSDKVCGLLFDISAHPRFWEEGQGLAMAEKLKDNVIELNSLDDAEEAGIIARTGKKGLEEESLDLLEGIPYFHIKQFFGMAGGRGRLFVAFVNCTANWNALIDMQKAANGMISQFGVWTEQNLWSKMDPEAPNYSLSLVGDLETVAEQMANDYFSPACVILSANTAVIKTQDGTSNTVAISEIPSCKVQARYVSVLLSQSMDAEVREMQGALKSATPVGSVGLALGALTQASVGESIGWVAKFDLANYVPAIEMGFGNAEKLPSGLLTNSTRYSAMTKEQLDALDDKGYVFMRSFEGMEGHVFFTKDQTCSDGDYCTIARNRTINKSRRAVRRVLLPYVNSPVKVDPANGNISSAQATVYTNLVTDALTAMETAEEISGVGAVNVPLEQNILVTKKLQVSYTLIPLGCAESIEVTEGLAISR